MLEYNVAESHVKRAFLNTHLRIFERRQFPRMAAIPQQSPGCNSSSWRRRKYWRRIPQCYCHRKVLMLMVWKLLFRFPRVLLVRAQSVFFAGSDVVNYLVMAVIFGSTIIAPLFGWLADVKLGRYKAIIYGAMASFTASILFSVALLAGEAIGKGLTVIAIPIQSFGSTISLVAILPFMTDQLIGATSDELSAIVHWFYWVEKLNTGLNMAIFCLKGSVTDLMYNVITAVVSAVAMAVIIISDCLCQQSLDKTHKISNPIKLIIQVLNYARKHSYPERRSAFTYIDEEHPSRLDFGKEKFGGSFSEEEVEDVKTVLRLIPLVACISLCVSISSWTPLLKHIPIHSNFAACWVGSAVTWIAPLILIPLYQLVFPLFHRLVSRMLRSVGIGLALQLLGFAGCMAVKGCSHSGDLSYLTCTLVNTTVLPGLVVEWYWQIAPMLVYSVGRALVFILVLEFCIAQSPDKMKGLVIGLQIAFTGVGQIIAKILKLSLNQMPLCIMTCWCLPY